jgi:GTP-binding protein HflX
MSEEVTGNTAGLKASQLQALERLYRRRVTPTQIVSAELATTMSELAFELRRQVGVLLDRRGSVTHVVVGDASKLDLPDVGRLRGAAGRFRGLRLVHTHLRGEGLTRDDLTDLALLRLDAVAAIVVEPTAGRASCTSATSCPTAPAIARGASCRPSRCTRRPPTSPS